jgi:hypothetical protein
VDRPVHRQPPQGLAQPLSRAVALFPQLHAGGLCLGQRLSVATVPVGELTHEPVDRVRRTAAQCLLVGVVVVLYGRVRRAGVQQLR